MKSRIRVGLIGANSNYGWSPAAHIPALKALPQYDLVAVCTAHHETAKESAKKFGIPQAFHNHLDMLDTAEIDAIGVVVRVPKHYQLTMDSINAGKHVYTEWPLGRNLAEAEEMASLAREKRVQTIVGLQIKNDPIFLWFKDLVANGYLGELTTIRLSDMASGALARSSTRTWQSDRDLGATTLTLAAAHDLDLLVSLFGPLAEFSASVSVQVPQWLETDTGRMVGVSSPDTVLLVGKMASGAAVSLDVCRIPFNGSGYRIEAYGRSGTLIFTLPENPGEVNAPGAAMVGSDVWSQFGKLMGAKEGRPLEELHFPKKTFQSVPESILPGPALGVAQTWSRFAQAIRSGQSNESNFDMAVAHHKLLDAIQYASDTGEKQVL